MSARQLIILTGSDPEFSQFFQQNAHNLKSAVWIGDNSPSFIANAVPYQKAKNLLGQEHQYILYDARQGIHLDALAISVGTLKRGGILLMLCEQWQNLTVQKDQDSVRWAGQNQAIFTPHFYQFLQQKVAQFAFPIQSVKDFYLPPIAPCFESDLPCHITPEQADLLNKINQTDAEIIIVTAKRGRGKSALAGFVHHQLQQNHQPVIVTAPNKSAVKILQKFADQPLNFIAPDELVKKITEDFQAVKDHWLIIDEAAMLPLATLNKLIGAFKKVLCCTTIQSYEGTGKGFLLKFMANLHRTFVHFQLNMPLRWDQDDKLEPFIDELLLLEAENAFTAARKIENPISYQAYSQQALIEQGKLAYFYGLLSLAHYRTSPLDLRRLFDAPQQQFYLAESDEQLIGGVWLMEEGKFRDPQLIEQIAQGVRRPRGNLVAQALCFQAQLPQACTLSSLRISRIAVLPDYQQQGIGQQLIQQISQHSQVDFLSVSFGYSPELVKFWQKCGFFLVNLTDYQEASSGYYTVMAVKPLSQQGHQFCQQAKAQFERNVAFYPHPLAKELVNSPPDWQLSSQDRQILQQFSQFHLPFFYAIPAILRLMKQVDNTDCPHLSAYFSGQANTNSYKKQLQLYRQEVNKLLQKWQSLL